MWWHRKPSPEVEAALSRVTIFSTLEPRDLRKLSAACLLRHYRAGESVLKEGSTGLGMFLITTGRVEVFKSQGGRKVQLAVLGDGAVLGEIALLDDQPRSASAVALEDTDCLLLSRDRFRTLLSRRPRIAWPIVPSLARRVRDLQERLLEAEKLPSTGFIPAPTSSVAGPSVSAPSVSPPSVSPPSVSPPDSTSASETPEPVSQPAIEQAPEPVDHNGDSGTDVLRAPYAVMMTGVASFGESARLFETFFRSLDETSGLAGGRPMGEVLRDLPESLVTAGMSSWQQGRRLPSKLLETFRDHLRSDWREEDRS